MSYYRLLFFLSLSRLHSVWRLLLFCNIINFITSKQMVHTNTSSSIHSTTLNKKAALTFCELHFVIVA